MINKKTLESLKQIDVSKDKELTKIRVKETWQGLDQAGRQGVLDLAGITKNAVARSYTKGNITPRLAAAFALVLSINPHYLTGETESVEGYSEELLTEFMNGKTNAKKKPPKSTAKKSSRKQAPEPDAEPEPEPKPAVIKPHKKPDKTDDIVRILSKANALSQNEISVLNNMPEDEIIYLVKALLYRSKYSADANEVMFFVRFLLTI